MEFLIYDINGGEIHTGPADRINDLDWENMVIPNGNYFVVGSCGVEGDPGYARDVYHVKVMVTDAMEKVIAGVDRTRIDTTVGGYKINVVGFLNSDGKLIVEVPPDHRGRNSNLIPVVKSFIEQGKRVFCGYTGARMFYELVPRRCNIEVKMLGGGV